MEELELTFRFDDELNSLTRFKGLPIDVFALFLKNLSDAIDAKQNNDIFVSEIKGNCYAPVISTNSITKYAEMKALHEGISTNNYTNLNAKQKEYAKSLKKILGNKYYLDIYDNDKNYYKSIKEINIEDSIKHYYETTAIRGVVTRIGGKTVDSKPKILVSNYSHDIEISNEQDEDLKQYYKNGMLEFYISQRINFKTSTIESAKLEDFLVLNIDNNTNFASSLLSLSKDYGELVAGFLNSTVDE